MEIGTSPSNLASTTKKRYARFLREVKQSRLKQTRRGIPLGMLPWSFVSVVARLEFQQRRQNGGAQP